jgi:uncharacterized cofD-like protein
VSSQGLEWPLSVGGLTFARHSHGHRLCAKSVMIQANATGDRPAPAFFPISPPRIVAIGGGTGLPTVLRGLQEAWPTVARPDGVSWLTAIVTVMDDGGSSGQLRESLGILPPGDIRNCLAALAGQSSTLSHILHDRLPAGNGRAGHPIGNLLLAALTQTEGDILRAIEVLGTQMKVSGRVLPATLENVHLKADFGNGDHVRGETAITARRERISRLMLDPPVRPIPEVVEALVNADLIVVGPGSLYTSLLPNLLVDGVAATIYGVRATKVYVANLMTQPGETDGYSLGDHLGAIREHTGFELFDYVLANSGPIPDSAVASYAADGSHVVTIHSDSTVSPARTILADLASVTAAGQIRHDPRALGLALAALAADVPRPQRPLKVRA